MKTYDVYVQDKLFKTFESDHGYSIRELTVEIEAAINDGSLVVDTTKPVGIRVEPR